MPSTRINGRSVALWLGGGGLTLFLLVALLAPILAPHESGMLFEPLLPPGPDHPLGTNDIGQDILSRLIVGTRTSLIIATLATVSSGVLGLLVGLVAGYNDRLGFFLMRIVDVFLAVPRFPLIILMAAFLRPGVPALILFFTLFGWPRAARMVRAQVLSERSRDYVSAATALGTGPFQVVRRHLLPGTYPVLIVYGVMSFQNVILAESGLSFLGLGDPTVESWGLILSNAFRFPTTFITDLWLWWAAPPGLCITGIVLALTLLSFALDERPRARLRGRTGQGEGTM